MHVKKILIFTSIISILLLTSCSTSNTSDETIAAETYMTSNRLSAIEYSVYTNKQIMVIAGQLETTMLMIRNSSDASSFSSTTATSDANEQLGVNESFSSSTSEGMTSSEITRSKESLDIMQKARNEFELTFPSEGEDDKRLSVIQAMDNAIGHMEEYIAQLEKGDSTEIFTDAFENDFFTLTGLATLYYQ